MFEINHTYSIINKTEQRKLSIQFSCFTWTVSTPERTVWSGKRLIDPLALKVFVVPAFQCRVILTVFKGKLKKKYNFKKRNSISNTCIAFKLVREKWNNWLIKSTQNILTCMRFYSNQFNSILRWKHVEGFEFSATSRQRSFFPSKSTLNTTKKNLNFMYSELRIIS